LAGRQVGRLPRTARHTSTSRLTLSAVACVVRLRLALVDVVPNKLPVQLTSFIGREAECAAVAELVAANRQVTLTGAGGCGKTRLALRVATDAGPTFVDGVWWVDLAPMTNDGLLANAVAVALSIKEIPGQRLIDTVRDHFRDQRALLLLDNCEHVVDGCAELVYELLRNCHSLSILTTSREPIGVDGEVSWRVPSLRLPDFDRTLSLDSIMGSEAVRLFVDRATRVRSTFRLSEGSAPAVAEVCRRLDGIPLAIELAAARARMLTPEEIGVGLGDRFRLLISSTRTAPPRHQTLRASADWSYMLLSEDEQIVLRRVAVFAGAFTLDASEEVCSGGAVTREAVFGLLSRLVDRSLVQVEEEGPASRYGLHETIRQYAAEHLVASGEEDAVRARHLSHYVHLAERAQPEMESSGLVECLHVIDVELDNIRAAFDWGIRSGAIGDCLRLMSSLWHFWFVRGHLTEGRERFEAALAGGDAEPGLRAMALIDLGQLMIYKGDFVATHEFATEALKIARSVGDELLEGRALDTLGYAAAFLDPASAPGLFQQAESVLGAFGDTMYRADALNGLGLARLFEGDYAAARAALEEGVASSRTIGNLSLLTIGLGLLGYALELQGRLARAQTCLRESLAVARRLEDRVSTVQALHCLGFIEAHRGEHERAEDLIEQSVAMARATSPGILAFALLTLGLARYVRGDLEGAASALEETLMLAEDLPAPWLRVWSLALLGNIARVQGDLDAARSRITEALAAVKEGGVRVDVLIDAQGKLARALANVERAEALHHEAITAALDGQSILTVPTQLEAVAGLAGLAESWGEAARLFGAAEAARDAHGLARPVVDQHEYEADVERVRAALAEEEFRMAWEQGRAMSLDEAVGYASRGRGERRRPSSGWRSLTPSEIEVVRRVAEGLTNQQIAERLFVSPSTVKSHLVHIFAKLGISTRAELAAAATRRSLSLGPGANQPSG
jgi:predicted ATPase/ATP/maltotriose-dependent transcriptional regulator MalT